MSSVKSYFSIHGKDVSSACAFRPKSEYEKEIQQIIQDWENPHPTMIVKTSGSTGKPKKIELNKMAMTESAKRTISYFQLDERDNILVCLPMSTIAGIMMIPRAATGNLNLIPTTPTSNPLSVFIERRMPSIKFAAFVPFQLQTILENPKTRGLLDRIESILLGGATISNQLIEKFSSIKSKIYVGYGMTETMSHIAIKMLHPIRDAFYHTLDKISIFSTPDNCLGINMQIAGKEVQITTNDIAELKSDCQFNLLGRKDFVINSGGIKIHPEEIESILSNHIPHSFALIGTPNSEFGEIVTLVIDPDESENTNLDKESLLTLLLSIKALLGNEPKHRHSYPKQIIIKKLPKTHSGKLDRKQLIKEVYSCLHEMVVGIKESKKLPKKF